MNFIAAGLSDVGLQREHNEDSFCILPEHRLFVVADGMGGHRAGDVASKMATHAMATFFQATSVEDATWPFSFDPHLTVDENRLVTGIKLANKKIFEASVRHREVHGMGTTIVSALFARESGRALRGARRRQPRVPHPRRRHPPSSRGITACSRTTARSCRT